MYSIVVDGKVLDFRYVKNKQMASIQNFYIDDIFIAQIARMGKGSWSAITGTSYGVVDGFKSRFHASEYLLKATGYIKRN
jgi:hypothetical protein